MLPLKKRLLTNPFFIFTNHHAAVTFRVAAVWLNGLLRGRCCGEIEKINRVILMPNGLVALEDHPTSVEIVNGAKMNQGKWILVLIQSIDKLNRASEILKKQGYYDNWSQENLAEVVNWRTETTF